MGKRIAFIVLALLPMVVAAVFKEILPVKIPLAMDIQNQVAAWGGENEVFVFPGIILFCALVVVVIVSDVDNENLTFLIAKLLNLIGNPVRHGLFDLRCALKLLQLNQRIHIRRFPAEKVFRSGQLEGEVILRCVRYLRQNLRQGLTYGLNILSGDSFKNQLRHRATSFSF